MATPTTTPVDREQIRAVIAELLIPGGLPAKPAVLSRVAFEQQAIHLNGDATDQMPRLAVLMARVGELATQTVHGDYFLSRELFKVAAYALAWLDQLDIDIEEPPF